jgi:polyhydroxyalkanoate synthesis regulator phasin
VQLGNITPMLAKIRPALQRPGEFSGAKTAANPEYVAHICRQNIRMAVDDIIQRLERIERRVGGGSGGSAGGPHGQRPEGEFRGPGPRPPRRPEWMHGGDRFGPGADAPEHRMPQHGQMNRSDRPGERFGMPEEMRERMQQARQQVEDRMQQARQQMEERMQQARQKFGEMQERIEKLEAEVKRLQSTQTESRAETPASTKKQKVKKQAAVKQSAEGVGSVSISPNTPAIAGVNGTAFLSRGA